MSLMFYSLFSIIQILSLIFSSEVAAAVKQLIVATQAYQHSIDIQEGAAISADCSFDVVTGSSVIRFVFVKRWSCYCVSFASFSFSLQFRFRFFVWRSSYAILTHTQR